jgi:hypothetical protein
MTRKVIRTKEAAHASARETWLCELTRVVKSVEQFVATREASHLAWYTRPGSPGLFEHDLTRERLDRVIVQLQRVRDFTLAHKPTEADTNPPRRGDIEQARTLWPHQLASLVGFSHMPEELVRAAETFSRAWQAWRQRA